MGFSIYERVLSRGRHTTRTGRLGVAPERSGMELQRLMDQWEGIEDMGESAGHTATLVKGDALSGWTAEWVLRVLCAPHRVRASYQEEETTRRFDQAQRGGTR